MNAVTRLIFFGTLAAIAIFTAWFFPIQSADQSLADAQELRQAIIVSAMILLAFAVLLLEHWFTKPTDAIAAAISAALVIAPSRGLLANFGVWYYIYAGFLALIIITASLSILLFQPNESMGNRRNWLSKNLKDFSSTFGSSKVVYGGLFLLTTIFYVNSQETFFLASMLFAFLVILIKPSKLPSLLGRKEKRDDGEIGEVIGVQSKRTVLARLHNDRPAVRRFDVVEFANLDGSNGHQKGLIIDNLVLDAQQWVKVLTGSYITDVIGRDQVSKSLPRNRLVLIDAKEAENFLKRFVGMTSEKSSILELRFEAAGKIQIREGTLLQTEIEGKRVLYQVTDGMTAVKALEEKNEAGIVVGHAAQVGTWDEEELKFDRFGWVSEMSSPIVLADDINAVEPPDGEMLLGHIPSTNYPVFMDKFEAINCHTAVLGVTGTGKSVFSRNLIRTLSEDGMKVFCVDFTGEYRQRFAEDVARSLVGDKQAANLFRTVDALQAELAKFENDWNLQSIATWEQELTDGFRQVVKEFLAGSENIAIFELPDVANSTSILSYTRWFFKILFEMAKNGQIEGQICVVLEEAHTVVPEWNFAGSEGKGSQSLLNQIGQIALQGRKYGVGFLVIAQRTASVSKTVLTQCNTIIAFQQFDKTSGEFLANYMGAPMVRALQNLPARHAIAVGKAFRSTLPTIFEVPFIEEANVVEGNGNANTGDPNPVA